MKMRAFDISPLYRSSIGFDRLAQLMDNGLAPVDGAAPCYPPCNIERTGDDTYRISLAVAGFREDEIDIETHNGQLKISGSHKDQQEQGDNRTFLYRGIAERTFKRRFALDAHVKATGATMENGLLHVDLVREIPEEMRPRKIAVQGARETINA